ncbi:MAG: glycosyltransferase family 4 protein [Flavobacteriaceae bacterium]|jgi:glycosyltransferase involved in cell wall biosynthesis|nr:glycosyltransferase family 4 protein [Flavobacteriaceae bacterium]
MKRKKLLIISHTEHYESSNGIIVGWGATINEVNFLADFWEEVVHIGCLYDSEAPKSALPYTKNNIRFVPISPYGGKTVLDKLGILFKIPKIIQQVIKHQKGATEVQLRLPTSMGLFLLPLFSFFLPRKYTFWVKYAGDWAQQKTPLANKLQRRWLKMNWAKCKVTINGFWNNQPAQCYSFENPCLYLNDIENGLKVSAEKVFEPPYTFCFVGRVDEIKGMSRVIDAFREIPLDLIEAIHIVGSGKDMARYIEKSAFLGEKIIFHGDQSRNQVHQFMQKSHFFLLPSSVEGFPKVVAEAACYGTIPVVSNVSSIKHYLNDTNSFLWHINTTHKVYGNIVKQAVNSTKEIKEEKSKEIIKIAPLFTFDNYLKKLKENIL